MTSCKHEECKQEEAKEKSKFIMEFSKKLENFLQEFQPELRDRRVACVVVLEENKGVGENVLSTLQNVSDRLARLVLQDAIQHHYKEEDPLLDFLKKALGLEKGVG